MQDLTEHNQDWIKVDGKEITIKGIEHIIKVKTFNTIYPYKRTVISVYAEPDKNTKYYQDIKKELGDDWSTDLLASDFDEEIFNQIQQEAIK